MRLIDPACGAIFIAKNPVAYVEDRVEIDSAQGIRLRCPCGRGHWLKIGFANPTNAAPHPSCTLVNGNTHQPIYWQMSGSGLHDLTLSPSIDVWKFKVGADGKLERDGSCWHGHIQNGEIK